MITFEPVLLIIMFPANFPVSLKAKISASTETATEVCNLDFQIKGVLLITNELPVVDLLITMFSPI